MTCWRIEDEGSDMRLADRIADLIEVSLEGKSLGSRRHQELEGLKLSVTRNSQETNGTVKLTVETEDGEPTTTEVVIVVVTFGGP